MKELNNDPQIEVKQLCPKVSTLEFLRASLLFGLLFGMIALASMPQGTIPVLFLFAPDGREDDASSPGQNPPDPFRKESTNSHEERFSLPFGNENQRAVGQTVQATIAIPPRTEGNPLHSQVNESVRSNFVVTSFAEGPTEAIPSQQSRICEDEASQSASIGGYQPALEGVSETGFTTRGYQTSRTPAPGRMEGVWVENDSSKPMTQSQAPSTGGRVTDQHISGEVINSRVEELSSQLQQLGAVRFRLEKWGSHDQFYRFWCEMPLSSAIGTVTFFEAIAPRPEEAMENVVRQVENWLRGTTRPYQ